MLSCHSINIYNNKTGIVRNEIINSRFGRKQQGLIIKKLSFFCYSLNEIISCVSLLLSKTNWHIFKVSHILLQTLSITFPVSQLLCYFVTVSTNCSMKSSMQNELMSTGVTYSQNNHRDGLYILLFDTKNSASIVKRYEYYISPKKLCARIYCFLEIYV